MKRSAAQDEDFPRGGVEAAAPGDAPAARTRPLKRRSVALPRADLAEDEARAAAAAAAAAAACAAQPQAAPPPPPSAAHRIAQEAGRLGGVTPRTGTFVEPLKYKARVRGRRGGGGSGGGCGG